MTPREEVLKNEMNPNLNPLIPGGTLARNASAKLFHSDNSAFGVRLREKSIFENPLIPSSPICKRETARIMCEGGNLDSMTRSQIKFCVKLHIAENDRGCPCGGSPPLP